jgi:hypothetical protein
MDAPQRLVIAGRDCAQGDISFDQISEFQRGKSKGMALLRRIHMSPGFVINYKWALSTGQRFISTGWSLRY